MTGPELVDKFYSVNLRYLEWGAEEPAIAAHDRAPIVLFLLGLIETVYIMDPNNTDPVVQEFLDVN